jgi:hypothetical protein
VHVFDPCALRRRRLLCFKPRLDLKSARLAGGELVAKLDSRNPCHIRGLEQRAPCQKKQDADKTQRVGVN